jgi:hypothetical protein
VVVAARFGVHLRSHAAGECADRRTTSRRRRTRWTLQQADYRSVGEFRKLAPALRRQYGAPVADIGTCLRNFDYERALTLLRGLGVEESR